VVGVFDQPPIELCAPSPTATTPPPPPPPQPTTTTTSEEAKRRLADFGPNQLTPPHKAGFFERLWRQLNNIVIWILFAAAIVEGAFQSWAEFTLVLLVIVANTAIGLVRAC